jgi:hypothetical protein
MSPLSAGRDPVRAPLEPAPCSACPRSLRQCTAGTGLVGAARPGRSGSARVAGGRPVDVHRGRSVLATLNRRTPQDATSLLAQESSSGTYDRDTGTLIVVGDGGSRSSGSPQPAPDRLDDPGAGQQSQGTEFYDQSHVVVELELVPARWWLVIGLEDVQLPARITVRNVGSGG